MVLPVLEPLLTCIGRDLLHTDLGVCAHRSCYAPQLGNHVTCVLCLLYL